ncbi:MAG: hypothetical protein JKY92_05845 [Magnetovibrio sp.]|nr:hypothetical protein [Magnetovibrio sp.]
MAQYSVEHIALDMEFYHEHSSTLRPASHVVKAFEHDKEHAEIFMQKKTGTAFSQVEILNWFLLQTQTTIADHLPKNSPENSPENPIFLAFPIRFKENTFSVQTEEGEQDLSHLKLMCKITEIH